MTRSALLLLVALPALSLVAACGSDTTVVMGEDIVEYGITVSGTGEAAATPDMATIDLGVEVTATTVAAAREGAAAAARRVIDAAKAQGVADRDLQTRTISISPVYDYSRSGTPTVTGYIAANFLVVRVRDLARLPAVIDAATAAGGDAARLQGITFGFNDEAALRKTARENAIADARQRAETYAAAAGVQLGEVISIVETSASPPVPFTRSAAADTATPIEPGESTVAVSVTVRFAIAR